MGIIQVNMIRKWMANARSASLVQSLMPAVTAVVLSLWEPDFRVIPALLAVLGVACAHLAFNLLDDYFDYISHKTGYRETLARAGFRAYTAKCGYITDGSATLGDLRCAIMAFSAIALLCGGIIFCYRSILILPVVAATAFLGWFYSGKPLRLSYHGLGEPVIGIIFGPLNMMGVSASACGRITASTVAVGMVAGLLVTNILYTHSYLDYAADQSVGKITLAGIVKDDAGRLRLSYCFTFGAYGITAAAVMTGVCTPWYLLMLVSLPKACALAESMRRFSRDPSEKMVWKRWYGLSPVDFEQMEAAGIDWFLKRWILSRNLVGEALGMIIIGHIISRIV